MGRVALFGSTDVTLAIAEAILRVGQEIASVTYVPQAFRISYSDKPVSVSRQVKIAEWCAQRGIPALEYVSVETSMRDTEDHAADIAVVAGWYHMVPQRLRDRFPLGAVGLHASRLPELRGGAPLNWAMLAGFKETAVTLFQLSDGVDDGAVFGQASFPIQADDYIADVIARCNGASVRLIEHCLPAILDRSLQPSSQTGVPSYGAQRSPEDGLIDWNESAEGIVRLVRAVSHPYPGAYAWLGEQRIRIWRARTLAGTQLFAAPGQLMRLPDGSVAVAAGEGALIVEEAELDDAQSAMLLLQKASHRRLRANAASPQVQE